MVNEASLSGRFPVKQAVIAATGITTAEIVAAVPGKSIRVVTLMMTVAAATNLQFQDGDTTVRSGIMEFADSGGLTIASEDGIFWTAVGQALDLDIDAAATVGGVLTYLEIPGA